MSKLNLKQRKALRSAAARKGWDRRRQRAFYAALDKQAAQQEGAITYIPVPEPVTPVLGIAAWIKAQWLRVFG